MEAAQTHHTQIKVLQYNGWTRTRPGQAEHASQVRQSAKVGRERLHWLRHFLWPRSLCVRLLLHLHRSPLAAGKIDVIQLPATGNSRRQSLKIGYKRPHNQSQNQRKFLTVIVFLVLYSNFFIFPYDQLWESGPDVDDDGASRSREITTELWDGRCPVAEMPRYVAEQWQTMMALSWHGATLLVKVDKLQRYIWESSEITYENQLINK